MHRPLVHLRSAPLCDGCLAELRTWVLGPSCPVCAEPLGYEPYLGDAVSRSACESCTTTAPPFIRATAFASYDAIRPILRLLKFEGVRNLAGPLGRLLAEAILQHGAALPERVTVVPVPLFRRKRLYNQSVLLAREAVPLVREAHPEKHFELAPRLLRRVHQKESQYRLSPSQRRANVSGAFQVRGDARGRHILLVDDVYTTGATATECAEVLLAAGAASVRVATLARAGREVSARWSPPTASMSSADEAVRGYPGNLLYPVPLAP